MPRLILEGFIVFAAIYGIFWAFTKGSPDQNRKALKNATKLVIGGVIAAAISGIVVLGLIQLNHIF